MFDFPMFVGFSKGLLRKRKRSPGVSRRDAGFKSDGIGSSAAKAAGFQRAKPSAQGFPPRMAPRPPLAKHAERRRGVEASIRWPVWRFFGLDSWSAVGLFVGFSVPEVLDFSDFVGLVAILMAIQEVRIIFPPIHSGCRALFGAGWPFLTKSVAFGCDPDMRTSQGVHEQRQQEACSGTSFGLGWIFV